MQISPTTFDYVAMVTHAGVVIAFAATVMEPNGSYEMGYSVLLTSGTTPENDTWTDFEVLTFPTQLRPVGMRLLTLDFGQGGVPVAYAPFQVVSDGVCVYVFRQSSAQTLLVDRFVFDPAQARLSKAWDVRFRRSQDADVPESERDTFGSTDMTGTRFVEPTIELTMINQLANGWFSATILPTSLQSASRWQIFAYNSSSTGLDSYSILRSEDGLFDLTDCIDTTTSPPQVLPNAKFTFSSNNATLAPVSGPAVTLYTRQEQVLSSGGEPMLFRTDIRLMLAISVGTVPQIAIIDSAVGQDGRITQFTGSIPVPVTPAPETALRFDTNASSAVIIPNNNNLQNLTVSAWVKVQQAASSSTTYIFQSGESGGIAFMLALKDGAPLLSFCMNGLTTTVQGPAIDSETWVHLAGGLCPSPLNPILYINGEQVVTKSVTPAEPFPNNYPTYYLLGGAKTFTGQLSGVCLWNLFLDQTAVLQNMYAPDTTSGYLLGYWPLREDPANPTVAANKSSVGPAANGALSGAVWSSGQAPASPSMPVVAFDKNGLDLCAALLPFAISSATPFLLAAADGDVHLYYQNASQNASVFLLYAARLSTVVGRANYTIGWSAEDPNNAANSQSGLVRFVARQPGIEMNLGLSLGSPNPLVQISTPANGTCTVTLSGAPGQNITTWPPSENWQNVPADPASLVAVLSGNAVQSGSAFAPPGSVQYDYQGENMPATGSALFNVRADTLPTNGIPGAVNSGPGLFDVAGFNCQWIPFTPPASLSISTAVPGYVQILTSAQLTSYKGPLDLSGSLTMEAWVNPSSLSGDAALICYANSSELQYELIVNAAGALVASNSSLSAKTFPNLIPSGHWTHVAATYQTDFGVHLTGERYLNAGSDESLNDTEAVTIEAWVKLDSLTGKRTVVSKVDAEHRTGWSLFVDDGGKPGFAVAAGNGKSEISVVNGPRLKAGFWHHLAAVYDVSYKRQTAVFFPDTSPASAEIPALANPITGAFTVEAWVKLPNGFTSDGEVFTCAVQKDTDYFELTCTLQDPSHILISVGGKQFKAQTKNLPAGSWFHVAGTFNGQNLAYYVNGCLESSSATGKVSPQFPADQAYTVGWNSTRVEINEVRLWNIALSVDQIRASMGQQLVGDETGLVGYWPMQDRYGTTAFDRVGSSNAVLTQGAVFIPTDKGQFLQKLFVDGKVVASQDVTSPIAVSHSLLRLGASDNELYLQGTLDDVMLWKVGLHDWEIAAHFKNPEINTGATGLISVWQMNEGSGRIAYDGKSGNNAVMTDDTTALTDDVVKSMWVPTDFKAAWKLFINGLETDQEFTQIAASVSAQMSLGGLSATSGESAVLDGFLGEVRIWNRQLDPSEISSYMLRPLTGAEESLVGYWPMNEGSGNSAADLSPNAAYGILQGGAAWNPTGPPVSTELPQAVSVPGGSPQDSSEAILGTPAVAEFGSIQTDSGGLVSGMLRRACLLLDTNKNLKRSSNFAVGNLDVEYVGQVQTNPTVIGYIEGAPPLPSENLTVDNPTTPYKYLAASSITLTGADNTTFTYSSSRDSGLNTEGTIKLGGSVGAEATVGIGGEVEVADIKLSAGILGAFEYKTGWLSGSQVATELTQTVDQGIDVFGSWVKNVPYADGGSGLTAEPRIYVPNNKGLALVTSGTADMYALRLRGTGALVAYSMKPSPDVPDDINLIMFVINPAYVKNGSLDGWFGFKSDPAYSLSAGQYGSYFKPLEAYSLRQQIAREQNQLRTYFDQFDAGGKGRSMNRVSTKDLMKIDPQADSDAALLENNFTDSLSRRNMVNTYVWNSDGGLFQEEEQFLDVVQKSYGGNFEFVGKAGLYAELQMRNGVDFSMSALTGGHLNTQVMKTRDEGKSFGITVKVSGEGFLNQRLADTDPPPPLGAYPVPYDTVSCPGKVNQYRFMTFYIKPSLSNFETLNQIIDTDWLASTTDPDAYALRQALSNANEVWRVLHRVTYVNRLADTTKAPTNTQSVALPVRQPDADSQIANVLLLKTLVVPPGTSNPLQTISSELTDFLFTLFTNALWGQQLQAQQVSISARIMTYMRFTTALGSGTLGPNPPSGSSTNFRL